MWRENIKEKEKLLSVDGTSAVESEGSMRSAIISSHAKQGYLFITTGLKFMDTIINFENAFRYCH